MISFRFARRLVFVLCFCLTVLGALSQAAEYEPTVGQEGKDVVWVPTPQTLVDRMLDVAKVTARDYVIDLGSGDGRLVITAAKRGARALGIEYNGNMVALSMRLASQEGVTDKAQFIQADLFESDFSKATVITMFLLEEINLKLRPRILELKPGTRIVSNHFTMGEWKPDETFTVDKKEGCDSIYCTGYFWIVPAKVEGTWRLPEGELTLKQSFQTFSGTLKAGAHTTPVNGKLSGERIQFSIGNAHYTGRVSGSTMQGTVESGGSTTNWTATQIQKVFQAPSEKQRI